MIWINWQKGRQGTGYFKKKLFESHSGILCDLYLLKYPEGCHIPKHKDEIGFGKKHYRVNLVLKPAKKGGEFICEKTIINLPFLKVFRPDLSEHEVTKVEKGNRYILSFGLAL